MGFPNKPSVQSYTIPAGFSWPTTNPTIIAYSSLNNWSCNVLPEDLWDTTAISQIYYVDGRDGNDANSGLTWALRKKSIRGAISAASTSGVDSRIMVFSDNGKILYTRFFSWGLNADPFVSTVNLVIEAFDGRVSTGPFDPYTWTLSSGKTYVYETARSNVGRVFDPSIKNSKGIYREYTWATSIANCETTEGSWFTDNTTTYVHPIGNGKATDYNARVFLFSQNGGWNCNKNLLVRGFDFEGGNLASFVVKGGSTNRVIFDDCTFRYSTTSNLNISGTTVSDSVSCLGVGLFAAFNCKADMASKDGFNFHLEGAIIPSALLVNCSGYRNGSYGGSCNGFTCHDGVKAIDIGGKWTDSRGTNSGHVTTGTQIWSVGTVAGSAIGDTIISGSINFGAFGIWESGAGLGAPTMWLDSCRDIGSPIGLYTDNVGILYIRNHKGTGIRSGTITNY